MNMRSKTVHMTQKSLYKTFTFLSSLHNVVSNILYNINDFKHYKGIIYWRLKFPGGGLMIRMISVFFPFPCAVNNYTYWKLHYF